MTRVPGSEIARRARLGGDGREALFRELWTEHWPRLAAFLSAFGLGDEDGEDAAQDALVKAFERISIPASGPATESGPRCPLVHERLERACEIIRPSI